MKGRSSSGNRSGANGAQQATDMLRIRKELVQTRSKVADLQEELEEKTSLYLNAIKVGFYSSFVVSGLFICQNGVMCPLLCAIIKPG